MAKIYDKLLSIFERNQTVGFAKFLKFFKFVFFVLIGVCLISIIQSDVINIGKVLGLIGAIIMFLWCHYLYKQEMRRLLICQKLNDGLTKLFNK